MWYLGQVIKNRATGKLAVYSGCDVVIGSEDDSGLFAFTPNEVRINTREWTHVEDSDGNIVLGAFFELEGNVGFFGRFDYDKLPETHREAIRRVCEG